MRFNFWLRTPLLISVAFLTSMLFADDLRSRATMQDVQLSDSTPYDNRAVIRYDAQGNGYIAWNVQKLDHLPNHGVFVARYDAERGRAGDPFVYIRDQYMLDMIAPDSESVTLLLQRREGLERFDNADSNIYFQFQNSYNVLDIVRFSTDGRELFRTALVGNEGVDAEAYFLCRMSSLARLGFDGETYSVYAEYCTNNTSERTPDVHEGDYFVQIDARGRKVHGTEDHLSASHSSISSMIIPDRNETYTMTIGDGSPYGLQVRRYSSGRKIFTVVPYPDQDHLPYDDMYAEAESATDAGLVGSFVVRGDYIIAVMSTVETNRHPIKDQPADLLFLKLDRETGRTIESKWLTRTEQTDESMPYLMNYGEHLLLVYNISDEDFMIKEAAHLAVLNDEGNFIKNPIKTDLKVDAHSRFFYYPDGDVGWVRVEGYQAVAQVIRVDVPEGNDENSENDIIRTRN
ncbi:MAG: hypothetical protein KDK34_05705 [Leptospiraceae bacterium]|nr:hypothetical protein [Leptospiraceae bacterium]